jgi:hypothetical protein
VGCLAHAEPNSVKRSLLLAVYGSIQPILCGSTAQGPLASIGFLDQPDPTCLIFSGKSEAKRPGLGRVAMATPDSL